MTTHEQWLERQREDEIGKLPIPNEYRHLTFEDVTVTEGIEEALRAVRRWADKAPSTYLNPKKPEAGKGLLLFGKPGVGKTLLASILAQEMIRKAKKTGLVHFVTMEGFNRLRLRKMEVGRMLDQEDYVEEWVSLDQQIQHCYEVRLLVLDDVGQENMTEHLSRMLNELLRFRYADGRPTVITSNLTPYKWAEEFGNESLGSFIHQACKRIHVGGEDARPRGVVV